MLHERLRPAAVCTARPTYSSYSPARERKIAAMFDRVAIPPRGSILLALVVFALSSSSWRKGREKERKKGRFSTTPPLLSSSRYRESIHSHLSDLHSYCAIELMTKEKSERKPTDELDLWWKLVARRSKENNLWIERNGCNVFFRSGRRLLYVKLIPRSGERFSIQGYSR